MKTLTQRVTLREMQILEEKCWLVRRCRETGFVYAVVWAWKSWSTGLTNIEVYQAKCYKYPPLFSKNRFGVGGYGMYDTSPVGCVWVADPNNLITGETIRQAENMLKEIDSKSQAFFEKVRVETTPALRAYEEKCATLYDSNGKFIRENVWTGAGYQDAHSQDVLSQNKKP